MANSTHLSPAKKLDYDLRREVLLIRHPEIDRGDVSRCYGQTDLPLTPRGHEMIPGLVARAKEWQPEVVLSSDLQRCLQPARAITAACEVSLEVDLVWREIHMGEWENQPWDDLRMRHPELLENWMKSYVTVCAPGGESYNQLADRTFGALKILETRDAKRIWVMTHGGVIRAIVSRILHIPLEQSWAIETAYAAGVLLRFSGGGWKVMFT